MALDQRTIDCLALDAQLSPSVRRDGEAVVSERAAAAFNDLWRPGLQQFVDEMRKTTGRAERTYELVVLTSNEGRGTGHHAILVCTDARVVYAETDVGLGLSMFHEFKHGALVIRTRLRTLRPELQPGVRPALVWPGLGGSENDLQACLDASQPGPAAHLLALQARLESGEQPHLQLWAAAAASTPVPAVQPARSEQSEAPVAATAVAGLAPTGDYLTHAVNSAVSNTLRDTVIIGDDATHAAAQASPPPGWYPDPTGRQDHRWWDGVAWTDHAAKAGASLVDPLG